MSSLPWFFTSISRINDLIFLLFLFTQINQCNWKLNFKTEKWAFHHRTVALIYVSAVLFSLTSDLLPFCNMCNQFSHLYVRNQLWKVWQNKSELPFYVFDFHQLFWSCQSFIKSDLKTFRTNDRNFSKSLFLL